MRVKIISAKHFLKIAALILAAILIIGIIIGGSGKIIATANSNKRLPIYCVDKKDKIISISFDAAWGNEDTEELIKILDKYKIKATFFVVGAWVDKYPESVKALSEAGHEIQSHSDTHPHMASLSREQVATEINSSCKKIENITGKKPILFRAPYGEYSNDLIDVLESQGQYCIQWDVDSLDWKDPSPEQMTQTVTKKVKSGSIVLFHNAAKNTPAALPAIIEKLQADGYTFVKISDLIIKKDYQIDHSGMQFANLPTTTSESTGFIINTTKG